MSAVNLPLCRRFFFSSPLVLVFSSVSAPSSPPSPSSPFSSSSAAESSSPLSSGSLSGAPNGRAGLSLLNASPGFAKLVSLGPDRALPNALDAPAAPPKPPLPPPKPPNPVDDAVDAPPKALPKTVEEGAALCRPAKGDAAPLLPKLSVGEVTARAAADGVVAGFAAAAPKEPNGDAEDEVVVFAVDAPKTEGVAAAPAPPRAPNGEAVLVSLAKPDDANADADAAAGVLASLPSAESLAAFTFPAASSRSRFLSGSAPALLLGASAAEDAEIVFAAVVAAAAAGGSASSLFWSCSSLFFLLPSVAVVSSSSTWS